jgi:hypothetical protein
MVRRFYGPNVQLVQVKNLKRGMSMVRSRIGGVAGNPGLVLADVIGSYPVADGKYFVQCADGGGENVHGDKWAMVSPKDRSERRRWQKPSCVRPASENPKILERYEEALFAPLTGSAQLSLFHIRLL